MSTDQPPVIARYRTLGGAHVILTTQQKPEVYPGQPIAKCDGCRDHSRYHDGEREVRAWANKHAAECRALPPADAA